MKILFNGFAHTHMYGLYKMAQNTPGLEIAACLEQEEWARTAAIEKLGIHFEEDSYENWLKKDVDIVAIGVKYGLRGKAILAALKAGKHVISDKPICTSMEELLEIEKLAEEKALKVGCMLDLRYIPSVQSARKLLGEKSLGEVRNISFTGQHCIDYTNRPAWYFEDGMHGGTVNDLAIHGIDLVRELTGLEIVQTDAIRSWNAYAVKNPEFSDCAVFMTRLSNGAELMADVSYSAPTQVFSMPTYWNFQFWCERGLLTFNVKEPNVTVYEDGKNAPQIVEGIKASSNYLLDLMEEICTGKDTITKSVLASAKATLRIELDSGRRLERKGKTYE